MQTTGQTTVRSQKHLDLDAFNQVKDTEENKNSDASLGMSFSNSNTDNLFLMVMVAVSRTIWQRQKRKR